MVFKFTKKTTEGKQSMSEVVPAHAMKAYMGKRGIRVATHILRLRWESCLGAGKK